MTTPPRSRPSPNGREDPDATRAGRPAYGPAEPVAAGPLRAILSRWWLVVLTTAICVGAAVAVAASRAPTYSASSDVNVGRTDVRVQALPGYVAGAEALASSYSRVATSDQIVDPVARKLGLSPREVRKRLSAAPIPDAPIFRITGKGPNAQAASGLANAATDQVSRFVRAQQSNDGSVSAVLRDYRSHAATAARRQSRLERLKAGNASSSQVQEAQVAYDTARLQADALGSQYSERSSETAATAGLQVLSRAGAPQDDKSQTLQELATVGIIAGVLIGAALALLFERASRRRRRSLPAR